MRVRDWPVVMFTVKSRLILTVFELFMEGWSKGSCEVLKAAVWDVVIHGEFWRKKAGFGGVLSASGLC